MTRINDPAFYAESTGGGAESVPDPQPDELGGPDTVEANDELTVEEVER
jgi:hypothetical protein